MIRNPSSPSTRSTAPSSPSSPEKAARPIRASILIPSASGRSEKMDGRFTGPMITSSRATMRLQRLADRADCIHAE